jgi:hypothetical protein
LLISLTHNIPCIHCRNVAAAVDAGFYDVNSTDTFLIPTNEAWGK